MAVNKINGLDQVKQFNLLAQKLAINSINASVDEKDEEDAIKKILKNGIGKNKHERFIVVVGAGVSYDENKGIPLSGKASKKVLDKLIGKNNKLKELYNNEVKRLEEIYSQNVNEFEIVLMALSKFFSRKDIAEVISTLYNHRYYPSMTHEILAHMLSHHYIDAIINFNFDELLDQAIEDEQGEGEYYHIVSDGDANLKFEDLIVAGKLKMPIYIKPHGTASHKSTLRFTKDDYFSLPLDIENLISILVEGGTSVKRRKKIPVNIIIIGFGMLSAEFNRILNNKLPEGSQLYFINISFPAIDEIKPKSLYEKYFIKNNYFEVHDNNPILQNTIPGGGNSFSKLDKLLINLWLKIEEQFNDEYKPRWILRHELIAKIFSSRESEKKAKLKSSQDIAEYLIDRTYIEMLLSIAKSKGFLNYSQLSNDRAGRYYQRLINTQSNKRYNEKFNKFYNEIENILNSKAQDESKIAEIIIKVNKFSKYINGKLSQIYKLRLERVLKHLPTYWEAFKNQEDFLKIEKRKALLARIAQLKISLITFCQDLQLMEVGFSREALRINNDDYSIENYRIQISPFENYINRFFNTLDKKHLFSVQTVKQIKKYEDRFKYVLLKLYQGTDTEFCPIYDNIYNNKFLQPYVIATELGIKYYTNKFLGRKKNAWNALLIISETGKWLLNSNIKQRIGKRNIALIVADNTYMDEIKKMYSKNLLKKYWIQDDTISKLKANKFKFLSEIKGNWFLAELMDSIKDRGLTENDIKELTRKTRRPYIKLLPWWKHNEHMTIFIKLMPDGKTWDGVVKAIYFSRSHSRTYISPLILGKLDGESAAEIFFAYIEKQRLTIFTKEQVKKSRAKLIDAYKDLAEE